MKSCRVIELFVFFQVQEEITVEALVTEEEVEVAMEVVQGMAARVVDLVAAAMEVTVVMMEVMI